MNRLFSLFFQEEDSLPSFPALPALHIAVPEIEGSATVSLLYLQLFPVFRFFPVHPLPVRSAAPHPQILPVRSGLPPGPSGFWTVLLKNFLLPFH